MRRTRTDEQQASAAAAAAAATAAQQDGNTNSNNTAKPATKALKNKASENGCPYSGTIEERTARVRNFIGNLRFTVPLKTLRDNAKRTACPKCNKQRLFYCYDCLVPCNDATYPKTAPQLPANVHIVLHPGEHRSKSTSLPAAVIAPQQITVHTFPQVPDLDPAETVLLYPSPTAVNISDLKPEELDSLKNVVFIDSTWQQSRKIERDAKIQSYRHVKIPERETLFWRFQNFDPSHLATVEAIYFTLEEIIKARNSVSKAAAAATAKSNNGNDAEGADDNGKAKQQQQEQLYNGEVDDLLLYYVYQYLLIQMSYAGGDDAEKPKEGQDVAAAAGAAESGAAKANDEEEDGGKNAAAAAATGGGAKRQYTERHFEGYILNGASFEDLFK